MEKVANHQQHQQLLQQQLHRAHLELGAAHQRITKNDELTALLEIKLEDSEFKREEAKKKHDGEMDKMAVDLQEVESFRAQAATDVVDLQRWVQQQGQQLSQVTADLLNLRQQQPPPHHPSTPGSDSQARAGLEQELRAPGLLTATHKSTQTPGPLTTSASGQPFTNLSPSLDCLPPSPQQQCRCRSSVATHPAPARRKMPPPEGAGLTPRAFPSLGLTLVVGLAVLGGLWIPAALASTVVTPSPSTPGPDRRIPEREDYPPPGSTGSGARDRPVSEIYTLKALKCPASTARLYPVDTVCGVNREPQSRAFPSSQGIRRKAFLLQRDRMEV